MGKKVLVVEDDALIGEIMATCLSEYGFNVRILQDGQEVWPYLKRNRPNLILLDLALPNEDGLSICRKVRHMPAIAEIPIVIVSAQSQPLTIQAAMEAGANDFIGKPFDIDELIMAAEVYSGPSVPPTKLSSRHSRISTQRTA